MRIQAPARQPEEKRPAKAGGKGYSARSRAGGGPQGMGRRGGRKKLLSNYAGPPRRPRHYRGLLRGVSLARPKVISQGRGR